MLKKSGLSIFRQVLAVTAFVGAIWLKMLTLEFLGIFNAFSERLPLAIPKTIPWGRQIHLHA